MFRLRSKTDTDSYGLALEHLKPNLLQLQSEFNGAKDKTIPERLSRNKGVLAEIHAERKSIFMKQGADGHSYAIAERKAKAIEQSFSAVDDLLEVFSDFFENLDKLIALATEEQTADENKVKGDFARSFEDLEKTYIANRFNLFAAQELMFNAVGDLEMDRDLVAQVDEFFDRLYNSVVPLLHRMKFNDAGDETYTRDDIDLLVIPRPKVVDEIRASYGGISSDYGKYIDHIRYNLVSVYLPAQQAYTSSAKEFDSTLVNTFAEFQTDIINQVRQTFDTQEKTFDLRELIKRFELDSSVEHLSRLLNTPKQQYLQDVQNLLRSLPQYRPTQVAALIKTTLIIDVVRKISDLYQAGFDPLASAEAAEVLRRNIFYHSDAAISKLNYQNDAFSLLDHRWWKGPSILGKPERLDQFVRTLNNIQYGFDMNADAIDTRQRQERKDIPQAISAYLDPLPTLSQALDEGKRIAELFAFNTTKESRIIGFYDKAFKGDPAMNRFKRGINEFLCTDRFSNLFQQKFNRLPYDVFEKAFCSLNRRAYVRFFRQAIPELLKLGHDERELTFFLITATKAFNEYEASEKQKKGFWFGSR